MTKPRLFVNASDGDQTERDGWQCGPQRSPASAGRSVAARSPASATPRARTLKRNQQRDETQRTRPQQPPRRGNKLAVKASRPAYESWRTCCLTRRGDRRIADETQGQTEKPKLTDVITPASREIARGQRRSAGLTDTAAAGAQAETNHTRNATDAARLLAGGLYAKHSGRHNSQLSLSGAATRCHSRRATIRPSPILWLPAQLGFSPSGGREGLIVQERLDDKSEIGAR